MTHTRFLASTFALTFSLLGAFGARQALAEVTDLYFSEYGEGTTAVNTAVELYNGTGAPINLGAGQYKILIYSNGSASATTFSLAGTIPAGGTWVVTNATAANAVLLAATDQFMPSFSFNGDDAIQLVRGTSLTSVDVIGQIGFDPGTEWGAGATSTANNSLRRKPSVCQGDPIGSNAFDPALEWDGTGSVTWDNFGLHTSDVQAWYLDQDNDGAGDPASPIMSCTQPNGYVSNSSDECPNNPLKVNQGQCGCFFDDVAAWSSLDSQIDGVVYALTSFDDGFGDGPALYAGGEFDSAGRVLAHNIARWNGSAWSKLSSGMTSIRGGAVVAALVRFDDGLGGGPALYAGGHFNVAGGVYAENIARWDGAHWSPVGFGIDGEVYALAVFDDGLGGGPALYAGGYFNAAGRQPATNIAKWDGRQWTALGGGVGATALVGGGGVRALTVFDDGLGGGPALIVGGSFGFAGGVAEGFTMNNIAKWDGEGWSPLLNGLSSVVLSLTTFDDGLGAGTKLIAGGGFSMSGGAAVKHVARWNGLSWSPLGAGTNDYVLALTTFDDRSRGGPVLCAAGVFNQAGGADAYGIATWNGSQWSPLGSGLAPDGGLAGGGPAGYALETFNDGSSAGNSLFVGGYLSFAGGAPADAIARWGGGCPPDQDDDGVIDSLDICPGYDDTVDCNANGVPDGCDIFVNHTSQDINRDGVPDDCQCFADLDHNGLVGASDLGVLLGNWGGDGAGDLDFSGVVGSADLGILLGAWGACSP